MTKLGNGFRAKIQNKRETGQGCGDPRRDLGANFAMATCTSARGGRRAYSRRDSNPQSPPREEGALSTRPRELLVRRWNSWAVASRTKKQKQRHRPSLRRSTRRLGGIFAVATRVSARGGRRAYSRRDSNPQSPPQEEGALSTRPHELLVRRWNSWAVASRTKKQNKRNRPSLRRSTQRLGGIFAVETCVSARGGRRPYSRRNSNPQSPP